MKFSELLKNKKLYKTLYQSYLIDERYKNFIGTFKDYVKKEYNINSN